MSYTKANTYTSGAQLDADEISENLQDARNYINGRIDIDDFAATTLRTRHIARPDPVYGLDTRYVSGLELRAGVPEWKETDVEYQTCHPKGGDFRSHAQYLDIGGLGKRFYMERLGFVIVDVYAHILCNVNDVLTDNGDSNLYYLYIDGDRQPETKRFIGDSGSANSGNPNRIGDGFPRVVPLTFIWGDTLAAGWHDIQVKCDAYLEHSVARIRTMNVHIMY